jgi:hypothetical protein
VSEEARKTRRRGDTRCLFTLNLMEAEREREGERKRESIRIDNIFKTSPMHHSLFGSVYRAW